jgi:hypothetical protein
MSRRQMPFGVPCHDDEEWTCVGCERIQCHLCDGIPSNEDEPLCWACFQTEDPGDDAA